MAPVVSVVIPCFNEVGSIAELHERIQSEFAKLGVESEIIFIDDGSTDGSVEILRNLAQKYNYCRVILLRRNCGKAAALQTGFARASGEYVLTIDADLQDDPAEIQQLLDALQQTDLVSGWKENRHDPIGKILPSIIFNAVVRNITGIKLHDFNCGLKGYRRQVIREINLYGELHRFIPVLAAARGFRLTELIVNHHPRKSGKSKYGWERILRGGFDIITVIYLTKYRFRPLHFFGSIGLASTCIGIIFGISFSIYLSMNKVLPSAWHNFVWIIIEVCIILGPIAFIAGIHGRRP